ncbi:MAG: DUF5615 family PIN-like protein [Gammaproteobacteria bacterium]
MTLPPQASAPQLPIFLCDAMLQRLGRWLRVAGYDVVMAREGETDYELLRRAIDEGRLLLTRDRQLAAMRRAADTVILLQSDSVEACAQELATRLALNWLLDPFSRCLQCNTLLIPASAAQRHAVPEDIHSPVYYCPVCQQVFWDGSHVQRMRAHLARWQQGDYCLSVESQDMPG